MKAPRTDRFVEGLPVVIFAALPVVGLVAGPSFAALIFGLGVVQCLYAVGMRRIRTRIDRVLLALAVAFAGLCWATVIWSIVPEQSARGALQITAIFAASLVTLGNPLSSTRTIDHLFRAMQVAFVLGAAIIVTDTITGGHLQSLVAGKTAPLTKYNRGADYLVPIAWPVLASAWARRDRTWLALSALSVGVSISFGLSAIGWICGIASVVVFAVAQVSRRTVGAGLTVGAMVLAIFTPFLARSAGENRAFIASRVFFTPHLFHDGLQRLEIWDYMSARVFERPLLGWGLWSAKAVPVRAPELSQYLYASAGNYPHNQWLQLWLETGAIGAALGLILALVVLTRIRRSLAPPIQPFAYAAFASAIIISLGNFELTTDSWWAALVASAYLFRALATGTDQVNSQPRGG